MLKFQFKSTNSKLMFYIAFLKKTLLQLYQNVQKYIVAKYVL